MKKQGTASFRSRKQELSVQLLYDGERFSVPNNVYLLGTMNTADRSLALLDTALRRRFDFVEMMPDPDLLSGVVVEGIDVKTLLENLNNRLELLIDREHTIGHAFFLPLKKAPSICVLLLWRQAGSIPAISQAANVIKLRLSGVQRKSSPPFQKIKVVGIFSWGICYRLSKAT